MKEDLSDILEKLNISKDSISPEMIDNIMNIFSAKSSDSTTDQNDSNNFSDIDIETILKVKSIMDKMKHNTDNPRARLLQDLKPYLNETKQNKIDQYVKLDKLIELLPLLGGDFNTHFYSDNQALFLSLIFLLFQ